MTIASQENKHKTSRIVSIAFLTLLSLFLVLNSTKIYQREPVVFYEPIIYPVEAISGDIVWLSDTHYFVVGYDMKINSIDWGADIFVVSFTKRVSLWQVIKEAYEDDDSDSREN